MPAPAELIVTGPDGAVTRYKLGERAIVGRHPECEVVLTDPMSSRRHCKVERTAAGKAPGALVGLAARCEGARAP